MSWRADSNGRVHIDLSRDDLDLLLMAIGTAAVAMHDYDKAVFWRLTRLANTINEGNPNFTPYEIPEGS